MSVSIFLSIYIRIVCVIFQGKAPWKKWKKQWLKHRNLMKYNILHGSQSLLDYCSMGIWQISRMPIPCFISFFIVSDSSALVYHVKKRKWYKKILFKIRGKRFCLKKIKVHLILFLSLIYQGSIKLSVYIIVQSGYICVEFYPKALEVRLQLIFILIKFSSKEKNKYLYCWITFFKNIILF